MFDQKILEGMDKHEISMKLWTEVENPKGVVQIFHGMAEHIKRYDDFARFLNKNHYIVVGHDHRGHGDSVSESEILGYLGQSGFSNVLEDGYLVSKYIKTNYPNLPIYLFAHSFGSFIAQAYITKYGHELSGLILSGSAKKAGPLIDVALKLGQLQTLFVKDSKKAKFLDKLSFLGYNKKIQSPQTPFDWLSRDESQVKKYIDDPLCGFICTINFFKESSIGLKELYDMNQLKNIPKDLSIFILSGSDDPVGEYSKSVMSLRDQYKALNLSSVEMKLYKGGRHEMLNEINRLEVYEDVLVFINHL
jgi:alpha-beta hydrolase superfamily lysophospholipase